MEIFKYDDTSLFHHDGIITKLENVDVVIASTGGSFGGEYTVYIWTKDLSLREQIIERMKEKGHVPYKISSFEKRPDIQSTHFKMAAGKYEDFDWEALKPIVALKHQ